ncbi:VWA domain-containing protein [Bremerella alba]|uniref:VWFA domain-containing protein n=1 Tax=Bremerella alba TaxID=980252 RepID=A0A7V9A8Y8_9BACT|nr:VWA domain-containing protein [Bremerella alba]MBA2116917.1 hypothetical protein [Bremerella alba]
MPTDLVARLKCIPEAADIDAALDRELSAVEIPGGLTEQLHEIAASQALVTRSVRQRSAADRSPRVSWAVGIWTVAATLLLALGIGSIWQINRNSDIAKHDPVSVISAPVRLAEQSLALEWLGPTRSEIEGQAQLSDLLPLVDIQSVSPAITEVSLPEIQVAHSDVPRIKSLSEELPEDLLASTFLMRWQPLGANPMIRSMHGRPQLLLPSANAVSFFSESQAYDREFLLRESSHPFASPQHPSMRSTSVPITGDQKSFENSLFSENPFSPEVLENARSEEWLAATGKFYVPAQPNQLELRTAAGPAVFAGAGTQLLEIGIVAGSTDSKDRAPVHLTVAVTPPESKQHALRTWLPVKIALREMIEQLRPHDSVTLVVMSDLPYVLIDDATSEHREEWFAALDRIDLGSPSNLAEGIRFASATSLTKAGFGDIRRSLVVLSDRFPALDVSTNEQLRPLIENASQQGVKFSWIQLEDENYASLVPAPSALHGMGDWLVTNSLQRLGRILNQQIHGAPSLIGTNPNVRVKWNQKSVAQYRLIGYQPVGGDFVSTSATHEFHALDSGTLLFELVLPEDGPNDIASIELTWNDTSGKARKSVQKVSRLQFAPSWQASPLSLQAAQLTQQSLALHQNSYFSRRRGNTIDELDNWASSLNPAIRQHASYPRLEVLLPSLHD